MGHALAERLLGGGHSVTVWNRTPDRANDLVSKGARSAPTPARAAEEAEGAFTSLADDDAVRTVVSGPDGVATGLAGGILIDASTVSPQTTSHLASAVAGRFLASPILGSPAAVATGEAAYLIGGSREIYDRMHAAFQTLAAEGRRRYYLGDDPKLASVLKLLSNYLLLSGVATLAEAVATCQAAGLGDELIRAYFGQSPLVAPALHNRLDDVISGDHIGWFSTRLGAKDARLAEELSRSHAAAVPVAEAVRRRYEQAVAEGFADADIAAVAELVRAPNQSCPR